MKILRRPGNDPLASIASVLTLAVGITACVTVFSVADVTLLRPLPYPKPDRLVVLQDRMTKLNLADMPIAWMHYDDYRNQPQLFEETAGFAPEEFTWNGASSSERVPGMRISPELLPMLGVQPLIGRNVSAAESRLGHDRVVLLSHAVWAERFASDRNVLGQSIKLDGQPHEIIGVLSAGFAFRFAPGPQPEFYAPVPFDFDPRPKAPRVRVLARLKPHITVDAAAAHMQTVANKLQPNHQLYGGPRGQAMGYTIGVTPLRDRLFGPLRRPMYVFCAAVALVLLIACLNAASLLLVRAHGRTREFALRQALGAGRGRIMLGVLVESFKLAAVAAVLGTLFAYWMVRLVVYLGPPELADVRLDWRSLLFASVLCIATACLAAVLPAVRVTRDNLAVVLRAGRSATAGPVRRRTLKVLVAVEVALALILMTASALLLRSFSALRSVELGFDREQIMTGVITLPGTRYRDPMQQKMYFTRLLDSLRASDGVQSATISTALPLILPPGGAPFVIEGRPFTENTAVTQSGHSLAVDPDYFKVFGIPLLAGRTMGERDDAQSTRVAVVNETLARRFFGGVDPIGSRILIGGPRPNAPWLTIIGVVKDVRMTGPAYRPLPQIYTSTYQSPSPFAFLVARSRGRAADLPVLMAQSVGKLDSEVALSDLRTMEQRVAASTSRPRFHASMVGTFAGVALALALAGIAGLVAYGVAQRTKEIGVRMAIGAEPRDVLQLMVRDGMVPVLVGAAVGLAASVHLSGLIKALLFETEPLDPVAYGGAAAAFIGVALIACVAAARRAAEVNPITALRVDG